MSPAAERSAFLMGLGVGLAASGLISRLPIGDGGPWALLFAGVALAGVGFFTRRPLGLRPPAA